MKIRKLGSLILISAVLLAGCNFPLFSTPPAPGGSSAPTPFQPGDGTTAPPQQTPEEVTLAFLGGLNGKPEDWQPYLTSDLRASLDPSAPLVLLEVEGPVDDFEVESGAVDPDALQALVQVRVSAGGREYRRAFTLLREDNAWRIAQVSGVQ